MGTGVVPISHANSDKRQQHHHIRGATKVVPISHANSEKPEKLVAATKLIGHGLDADQIPNTRGKLGKWAYKRGKLTGKSRSSLNLLGQPIQAKQQGKKGTDDSIENSGKEVLQQRLAGLLTNYKKIDSNNQGQGQGTDQDGDQDQVVQEVKRVDTQGKGTDEDQGQVEQEVKQGSTQGQGTDQDQTTGQEAEVPLVAKEANQHQEVKNQDQTT